MDFLRKRLPAQVGRYLEGVEFPARKEAAPEEERPPGSGGVKDNVRDELSESQDRR